MRTATKLSLTLVGAGLLFALARSTGNSQSSPAASLKTHVESMIVHVKGKDVVAPDGSCGRAIYTALAAGSAVPVPSDTTDPKTCAYEMSKALKIQASESEPTPWVPTSPVMTPGPPGTNLPLP